MKDYSIVAIWGDFAMVVAAILYGAHMIANAIKAAADRSRE